MHRAKQVSGFRAWFAVCGLAFATCSTGAEAPRLRLPDVVVPIRYDLDLSLDPSKREFTGRIAIDVKARQPVRELWLHSRNLKILSAVIVSHGKSVAARAASGEGDFLRLTVPAAIAAGPANLRIRYRGQVTEGSSSGIFHSTDAGNDYLLTQFEATDARAAFPCFDEPGYKTPWQLTLRIPATADAVSNTLPERDTVANGRRIVRFQPTLPIPSYLVAFGVGPFEFVDAGRAGRSGAPIRIVTPKGKSGEATYAAEVTHQILTRLEDYFGIPYPFGKSDQVAVPITFGFDAMENVGMVTYAQTLLLANANSETIARRRDFASVAAHELAHQWVGDLVTNAWWDDVWLNESFATWMEQSLLGEWKPEWNTRVADAADRLRVKTTDRLVTARSIRQKIVSRDDIANAFDDITYQKGAAVLGMFEHYLGHEAFRAGVHQYLKEHAFGSATASDFLAAIDPSAGHDVARAFSSFLDQPGVPLVGLELQCGVGAPRVHLTQKRLLPIGSLGSAAQTWSMPVCLRYPVSGATRSECVLMAGGEMDHDLAGAAGACPAWIQGNDGAAGYYVVDYRGALLEALIGGDVSRRLEATERVDLLGSAKLLADSGQLQAGGTMRLIEALSGDADRNVVQIALDLTRTYRRELVPPGLLGHYQRFVRRNFQTRARALGWHPAATDSEDDKLLRPEIVLAVATIGADEELAHAGIVMANDWLEGRGDVAPELLDAVLSTAAYYGDRSLAERMIAKLKSTSDRQVRDRIIDAMPAFRDPAALQRVYQSVLSGDVPFIEGARLLFAGQAEEATRPLALQNVKDHYDEILAKRPSGADFDFAAYLPYAGSRYCTAQSRVELQQFFESRAPKFAGGPRILAQVLEGIDLCVARRAAQADSVAAYLQAEP